MLPPLRILAADDVPQNLEVLLLLLSKLGHSVTGASDGVIALHLASEAQFDLVLMDVQMPGMDGLEATRRLREAEQRHGRRRTPVIAMTASVLERDRAATAAAGMDGFTGKPVDVVALTLEMARVLGFAVPTAGAAPSASGVAGPQAQVLNAVRGLQQWAGHEQAYLRALHTFAADNAGAAAELTAAAASGRHAAGRQHAHRIRGAAANLGLEQLAEALSRLEQALRGEPGADLPGLLALAVQRLAEALAAARQAGGSAPAAGAAVAAGPAQAGAAPDGGTAVLPDTTLLRELGVKLMRSLDSGSFDQDAMSELTEALRGSAAPARLAELQRALDDFEFATAQARLQALLADYLPRNGGAS